MKNSQIKIKIGKKTSRTKKNTIKTIVLDPTTKKLNKLRKGLSKKNKYKNNLLGSKKRCKNFLHKNKSEE